jgi:hypothetical protein
VTKPVDNEVHAEDLIVPRPFIEVSRPWWFWLLVGLGVIAIIYGIGQAVYSLALYRELQDKDAVIAEQRAELAEFNAVNACRSQVAADDAVAQGNKQITSQRVIEVGIAAALTRDPSISEEQRAIYRAAAQRFNEVFIADVQASQVRYDMALRRANVIEVCASGEVPAPLVQPLPVAPVIDLPDELMPSSTQPSDGGSGTPTQPSGTTAPPTTVGDDDDETASPPPPSSGPGTTVPTTTAAPGTPTTTTVPPTTTTRPPGVITGVLGPIVCSIPFIC